MIPSEHQEQKTLFEWAALMAATHLPELAVMYAIPNGGHRNKVTAARLKAEGVKPGVPDICLPVARSVYHGLYIELKRRSGGRPTKGQRQCIERLNNNGYLAVVCNGWEEAKLIIESYLTGGANRWATEQT